MTITGDIPEELADGFGDRATSLSREGLGLTALQEGLWTEAELGKFLGVPRMAIDRFLQDNGVAIPHTWEDLERECGLFGGWRVPTPVRCATSCELVVSTYFRNFMRRFWSRLPYFGNYSPAIFRSWATNLPHWIHQASPSPRSLNDPRWAGRHAGETAALALAAVSQPAILLIDEWSARERALSHRLPVIGTLGILDEAAQYNLISFAAAIEKRTKTSFRYPNPRVERLLARHNRRQGRTQ